MKNSFLIFAEYNRAGDKTIYSILNKLTNEDRELDRQSYYGSLSGLFRHVLGGTGYMVSVCKDAVANNAAASKALEPLASLRDSIPEKAITAGQWAALEKSLQTIDDAFVNFAAALTDADLNSPVKLDWYGGNPATVPVSFMLSQALVHGTHHRGQISQILDTLKIDNDYSGIDAAFLPK
jgi:uncharacterized damage-inducible protein DinB